MNILHLNLAVTRSSFSSLAPKSFGLTNHRPELQIRLTSPNATQ